MARLKVISIVLAVLLTSITTTPSSNLQSASKFYFPHFVSGNGDETTFVISNSSAQDAEVRFTAYGDEGNLLAARSNQASITLTAQSQAQVKAADLFDIRDGSMVTGWVKAESINPQLTALMLISLGNIHGDQLDALAASDETAQTMAFSAVFETGDTVTGIGLANPDSRPAHVKASLYAGGGITDEREFQIPAYGHRAWFLNQLFQANVPAGHVEIESDVALAGLQTFSQADRWSAAPMQLAQDAAELLVPLPALGRRFSATIAVANLQRYDLNLNLTAYGNGGLTVGPVTRSLPAHGELIASISDLFGDSVSAGGAISIKADSGLSLIYNVRPIVSGLAILRGDDFNGLASFPLIPARARREWIFSPLNTQSSISLINGQNSGAKTRLSMIAADRTVVGENEIAIGARAWLSDSPNNLAKATRPGNLVLMSADQPLTTVQVESSDQGFFVVPGQTFKSRAVYSSGELLSHVSGGIVLSKDEASSVSIPLNALKEDVAIEVNELSPEAAPPVPANRRLLAATDFQPAGLEFLFPAAVKMPLLHKQTPGSSIPVELVNPPGNQYQPSGSFATVGPDGMSASAGISHFSVFALTSERPVVRVTPAPVTVDAGQTIQFTATVSGNGIQDVNWFVNGIPGGDTSTGTIRPDGFYTAPRTVPPLGWVDLKAFSLDDSSASFEVQITITPPAQPDAPSMSGAPDQVVLTGPVDPACAGCHAYR